MPPLGYRSSGFRALSAKNSKFHMGHPSPCSFHLALSHCLSVRSITDHVGGRPEKPELTSVKQGSEIARATCSWLHT